MIFVFTYCLNNLDKIEMILKIYEYSHFPACRLQLISFTKLELIIQILGQLYQLIALLIKYMHKWYILLIKME